MASTRAVGLIKGKKWANDREGMLDRYKGRQWAGTRVGSGQGQRKQ
jgi:hypothetical protein